MNVCLKRNFGTYCALEVGKQGMTEVSDTFDHERFYAEE
jgi:hypothetical protein